MRRTEDGLFDNRALSVMGLFCNAVIQPNLVEFQLPKNGVYDPASHLVSGLSTLYDVFGFSFAAASFHEAYYARDVKHKAFKIAEGTLHIAALTYKYYSYYEAHKCHASGAEMLR